MELSFKNGKELIKLIIDRDTKEATVATSKTNYRLTSIKWKMLFDKGKEVEQEEITNKLSDEEFKQIIILDMKQKGYSFINDISRHRK